MAVTEPTDAGRSWVRLDAVDLLRGLAILFVLMNHVNIRLLIAHVPYTADLPDQLVASLMRNGQYGVQIFFAISGFLITSTTLRRWDSLARVSVRDFYLLRFARIAPLLLLLLLLGVLSALHLANLRDFVVPQRTGGLGRALFAALTLHVNVLEARRGYLPGNWDILWSLSIEETFYLLFPLVCRLLGRGRLLIALLLAFVLLGPLARALLAGGNEIWYEYSYLGGMDAIALGCLTAMALPRVPLPRAARRTLAALGAALLSFTLGFSNQARAWGLGRSGLDMTIAALGACLIIVAAAQARWHSPRAIRPLLKLGQRSYEVYLTHIFVVFALFRLFLAAGRPLDIVPILFIAVVVIAGLLGEWVARFYSEPMNRRLRMRWGDGAARLGAILEADSAARGASLSARTDGA